MRKLLLSLTLLSAALLSPPSSRAQFIVVGQGCGAPGLSAIANDGTPVVCTQNSQGKLVWTAVGGGGGTPDPPVTANYSLTSTGAQAAINLTAAPIDTHSIQWRLGSSGLINSITDAVSYANGDLHTANANWVYTQGTFTVSTNIVYASASGVDTAYRSDGPNTGAEYAQQTMGLISAGSGSQVVGPCVRMSNSAATGYCVDSANDTLRIYFLNAGSLTTVIFAADNQAPVTGDTIRIQATGSTLSLYKNGVLLGSGTDTNLTTGFTGILGASNATLNGFNNFQSGTLATCNVALESSADSVTWSGTGAAAPIPVQSCQSPGSFTATQTVANYVRVNVTGLTSGQTLQVVYSGRLAGAPLSGNNSVSNGMWVQPGQVIWVQYTSPIAAVGVIAHQSARIASGNNPSSVTTTTWDVASCTIGGSNGTGTGFTVTQGGWLLSLTGEINSPNIPAGAVAVNEYVLNYMPNGGGTTACTAGLLSSHIGASLGTWPTGSFYPVGFVGTTGQYTHPWAIPGYTTVISPSTPAAGAEWSSTITGNARTCIQSISFTVAAGSTNITPAVQLKFSIGVNTAIMTYSGATAQTSATTQIYSFSPGAAAEVVTGQASPNTIHIIPFNNGQLACFNGGLSTLTVGSLTNGLNGTTAYTNIAILVQQQNDNN